MTDDTFAALQRVVLPWAKVRHPEKYEQTLKVAGVRRSFEAYLLRLLEIRYAEEPAARGTLPILALEETKLVVRARLRDGRAVEFKGRKLSPRTHAIAELAMDPEEWAQFDYARRLLDLEYIP